MLKGLSLATFLSLIISTSAVEVTQPSAPAFTTQVTLDKKKEFSDQLKPYQDHVQDKQPKSTFITMGLSALFPGLGNAYLGNTKQAVAIGGTFGAGFGAASMDLPSDISYNSQLVAQNTWMYGMYAAYRDLRSYNGKNNYKYQMANESFKELAFAPFQPSVLKKPEVWGGILGQLAVGITVAKLSGIDTSSEFVGCSTSGIYPVAAFPIGIGEEAFFRGCLQPAMSEAYNPTVGWISTSVLFGAAHIPNAKGMSPHNKQAYCRYIIPFLVTAGMYEGWLAKKNHSLKEAVAVHAWYDFILFAAAAAGSQSIKETNPSFQITFHY